VVAPSKSKRNSTRVRISKSGQITLPASSRKRLGVELGDYVNVLEGEDGSVSILSDPLLSLDEIMGMAVKWPDGESRKEAFADARKNAMVRERYRTGEHTDDPD